MANVQLLIMSFAGRLTRSHVREPIHYKRPPVALALLRYSSQIPARQTVVPQDGTGCSTQRFIGIYKSSATESSLLCQNIDHGADTEGV